MAAVTKPPTSAKGPQALVFRSLSRISCDFPLIIIIIIIIIIITTIIIIIMISRFVRLGNCSEIDDNQRGREAVNMEFEGSTEL
jgi:hypothetical protein